MHRRKTAILLTLCLLLQPAGSAAFAFSMHVPAPADASIEQEMSGCHASSAGEHARDVPDADVLHSSEGATGSEPDCCDTDCLCLLGGCVSVLGENPNHIAIPGSLEPESIAPFAVLQTIFSLPLRPPIPA